MLDISEFKKALPSNHKDTYCYLEEGNKNDLKGK
jgi:hypothetical protein